MILSHRVSTLVTLLLAVVCSATTTTNDVEQRQLQFPPGNGNVPWLDFYFGFQDDITVEQLQTEFGTIQVEAFGCEINKFFAYNVTPTLGNDCVVVTATQFNYTFDPNLVVPPYQFTISFFMESTVLDDSRFDNEKGITDYMTNEFDSSKFIVEYLWRIGGMFAEVRSIGYDGSARPVDIGAYPGGACPNNPNPAPNCVIPTPDPNADGAGSAGDDGNRGDLSSSGTPLGAGSNGDGDGNGNGDGNPNGAGSGGNNGDGQGGDGFGGSGSANRDADGNGGNGDGTNGDGNGNGANGDGNDGKLPWWVITLIVLGVICFILYCCIAGLACLLCTKKDKRKETHETYTEINKTEIHGDEDDSERPNNRGVAGGAPYGDDEEEPKGKKKKKEKKPKKEKKKKGKKGKNAEEEEPELLALPPPT